MSAPKDLDAILPPIGTVSPARDAAELYDIARWGKGYFSVDENGHVRVHPTKEPER